MTDSEEMRKDENGHSIQDEYKPEQNALEHHQNDTPITMHTMFSPAIERSRGGWRRLRAVVLCPACCTRNKQPAILQKCQGS
jgi:hypothetical protein